MFKKNLIYPQGIKKTHTPRRTHRQSIEIKVSQIAQDIALMQESHIASLDSEHIHTHSRKHTHTHTNT